jgi:hypothetical protein
MYTAVFAAYTGSYEMHGRICHEIHLSAACYLLACIILICPSEYKPKWSGRGSIIYGQYAWKNSQPELYIIGDFSRPNDIAYWIVIHTAAERCPASYNRIYEICLISRRRTYTSSICWRVIVTFELEMQHEITSFCLNEFHASKLRYIARHDLLRGQFEFSHKHSLSVFFFLSFFWVHGDSPGRPFSAISVDETLNR